jgi:hypothetical protein
LDILTCFSGFPSSFDPARGVAAQLRPGPRPAPGSLLRLRRQLLRPPAAGGGGASACGQPGLAVVPVRPPAPLGGAPLG